MNANVYINDSGDKSGGWVMTEIRYGRQWYVWMTMNEPCGLGGLSQTTRSASTSLCWCRRACEVKPGETESGPREWREVIQVKSASFSQLVVSHQTVGDMVGWPPPLVSANLLLLLIPTTCPSILDVGCRSWLPLLLLLLPPPLAGWLLGGVPRDGKGGSRRKVTRRN